MFQFLVFLIWPKKVVGHFLILLLRDHVVYASLEIVLFGFFSVYALQSILLKKCISVAFGFFYTIFRLPRPHIHHKDSRTLSLAGMQIAGFFLPRKFAFYLC